MSHPAHRNRAEFRRKLALIACTALAVLSACGRKLPAAEPVEITFLYPESDSALYTEMVETFKEQATEVTVKLVPTDSDESWIANISRADCFVGPAIYIQYLMPPAENNLGLAPVILDEMIAQDGSFRLDDYYPGPLGLVSRAGKIYAIPSGVNPIVMFYNRDLFDARGLPYPQNGWTWDDFVNTALSLRDPQAKVWGYVPVADLFDPILFVYQGGGRIVDDIQDPTRLMLNEPQTVKALEWFAALFHEHQVAPTSARAMGTGSSYRGAALNLLYGGKAGVWMGTYLEKGGENTQIGLPWPFSWGMVSLPRGEKEASFVDIEAYAISSKSEDIQTCWRWISFLSTKLSREARLVPARKSQIESSEYRELVGSANADALRQSLEDALMFPASQRYARFFPTLQRFGEAVDRIIQGTWTPQEAMDTLQKQAEP